MNNEIRNSPWLYPLMPLTLANNEIHIWRVNLDISKEHLQILSVSLSSEEQIRAGKFYFQRDRNCFIAARGILRTLVGHYLALEPAALHFEYSRFGKPSLSGEGDESRLFFNVSHSHELALLAFTHVGDIGVDVEYMRPSSTIEYMQLAQRFFSEHERSQLESLPQAQVQQAFFCCWTRKEAYIKARGLGLQLPLEQFDVSVHPDQPAVFLSTREEGQNSKDWTLYNLLPGPGYAGACVVKGTISILKCWQWTENVAVQ
jgi:4'-phosphopantetheinyl transferase